MSNFVYKKAKEAILNGQINFSSNEFKLLFVKTANYTASESSHEFLSSVNSNAIAATSSAINGVTNALGVIDAEDISIYLEANTTFEAIILFQSTGNPATSRLLFYIDTGFNLPFLGSPLNSSLTIVWDNNPTKILSL
jgi:hypothetical protein